MKEVTFWAHIFEESAYKKIDTLRELMRIFYNKDDFEVIIIKSIDDSYGKIAAFEQEYPENVMLVECDATAANPQEIMLGYAGGACFLEIDDKFRLDENPFDNLLYDAAICDEDNFKYIRNKYTYILLGSGDGAFPYMREFEKQCLADYRDNAGHIDMHYFYQDIYVASKVQKLGIRHIYDIGSRVDGYISHLLSMGISVTMIDVRPLNYEIKGLDFIQGNATELSTIKDYSLEYMSCLHALEHFGLGRYADPMDYFGWKHALTQYKRVLKDKGLLFLSVPVGKTQRVCFNAHRIFRPMTIVNELCPEMRLLEYANIRGGKVSTIDFSNNKQFEKTKEILDEYAENKMGEYDCGIFVFERTSL